MDEATEFELFPGSRRLEAKVHGIPHAAWPFIILAALVLAVLVGASGPQFTRSTLLLIADNVGWALLPAAVLIGCPTAWRSARPILVGAIAASTIGAVAELIWTLPVMVGGTSWMSSGRMTFSLLGAIGTIAWIAVIAATLERRRGTSTTWPPGLVALAVAGTAAACLYEGSTWLNWYNSQLSFIVQDKLAEQIMVLEQTIMPVIALSYAALAWSSLSALRAGEAPKRFWLAITAASTLLLAAYAYQTVAGYVFSTVGFSTVMANLMTTLNDISLCAFVAGIVLLLLAFAMGLPDVPAESAEVAASPESPLA